MDYLYQRNRWVANAGGPPVPRRPEQPIIAAGKRVVVVGGGDTGMDCISNALREGAARRASCSTSTPSCRPSGRDDRTPWPLAPKRTLTTYALDEGGEREWQREVTAARGRRGPRGARSTAAR